MGAAPVNQELLDYLAVDFIRNGWQAKRLHKLIMTSTAYRQSAQQLGQRWLSKARDLDPGNALLWRMNLRRLDAESLRDSIMAVAGKLNPAPGGPPVELEMRADGLQVISAKEPEPAHWRRSVYLTARRTYPMGFLGVFDYPIIDTNCTRRVPSATPLQSLTMLNDEFVWQSAAELAARAGESIERAYLLTLGRPPDALERERALRHLESNSFKSLAQALLSSNEFLYID